MIDPRLEIPPDPSPFPDRVKVIYVAGWARSSSTLLDLLLGEIDGFFSTGELRQLWQWGIGAGRLCGCGVPLTRCPLWSSILELAYGDPRPVTLATHMSRLQREAVRLRHLPRHILQRSIDSGWPRLGAYAAALDRLYRVIARVTAAKVVIDSSKMPQDAAVLPLLPGVDPYLVHLVRDPRAVANSMQRKLMMQESDTETVTMPTSTPAASTLGWVRANLAAEIVRLRFGPRRSMLVRYEDLVRDPAGTLESIAAMVAMPLQGPVFSGRSMVELHGNHTVWGNPSRFQIGRVEIRHDGEWVDRLSARDRRISTALSLALLPRYGYRLRASSTVA